MKIEFLQETSLEKLFKFGEDACLYSSVYQYFFDTENAIMNPANAVHEIIPEGGYLCVVGASGIVGFGKVLQFASRLLPFEAKVLAVDLPGAPFNWDAARKTLGSNFSPAKVEQILQNIVALPTSSDGKMTHKIADSDVRMIFEAIPEKLELKQKFFKQVHSIWSTALLLSATSGFQAQALFKNLNNSCRCTIAHPAFPHERNKYFEIVGPGYGAPIHPTYYNDLIHFFLALGLIPKKVKDAPSFVLDRIFCGLFNFCLQYMSQTHLVPEQIDKMAHLLFGPRVNPFFSHDYISGNKCGAANQLTFGCLDDLEKHYQQGLFAPHSSLVNAVGQVVNKHSFSWCRNSVGNIAPIIKDWRHFNDYVLSGLKVVIAQILHEKIANPTTINELTEGCTLFAQGLLVMLKNRSNDETPSEQDDGMKKFFQLSKVDPGIYFPERLSSIFDTRFYVNAEIIEDRRTKFALVTFNRGSYNWVFDQEINEVLDELKSRGITKIILAPDPTSLSNFGVGADVTEFTELECVEDAIELSTQWSKTARRLQEEFTSIALIKGKAWGGMLELALHCNMVYAEENSSLRFPEVTLGIVPGMEGLHLPFRKVEPDEDEYEWLFGLLMNGNEITGEEAATHGLINFVGTWSDICYKARDAMHNDKLFCASKLALGPINFNDCNFNIEKLPPTWQHPKGFNKPYKDACRLAIKEGILACGGCSYAAALAMQAAHSGKAMFAEWGFLKQKKR